MTRMYSCVIHEKERLIAILHSKRERERESERETNSRQTSTQNLHSETQVSKLNPV